MGGTERRDPLKGPVLSLLVKAVRQRRRRIPDRNGPGKGEATMDLSVGQRATRELTVDAAKVRAYAEITGDYNKLHFDEA